MTNRRWQSTVEENMAPCSRSSTARRTVAILALTVLVTAAGSPVAAANSRQESEHSTAARHATEAPSNVIGRRGTLLTARPLTTTAALPSAASNWLVTYVSVDRAGRPITVSGTVSLPATNKPPGGWPVLSWAHGTTGVADVCAPSADTADGPAHGYLGLVDETLDKWVADGYVVVQTDYEGLGTLGNHPYLNGESAANTMVDIVRAARTLDHRVGRDWFAMGHSQGGHAALFAAAQDWHRRDVRLRAAVSIAPGGIGVSRTLSFYRDNPDRDAIRAALPFLPILLIGAAAAEPSINPDRLLTDEAQPLLDAARSGCMNAIGEVAPAVPPDRLFRPDADLEPITRYLASQEPESVTPTVPTMVVQGTDDALVPKPSTDHLVHSLCNRYPLINHEVYDGSDHRETIADSLSDAQDYIASIRDEQQPPGDC
ncbi:alpha/beta hydrolase family protein [Haloactinomyces albus]|uniref:Pimeloyl-ACP methyl ester carboxylesterase n=1 Tax=Haloactinomyces albus TaxID=1352928 RepID=A0AAE3ZJ49_9ACTN|nr:hypothetical protein [Haloactinomyces albus]MDR7303854.1 pimeloyl-ACP methyl ester carboxylesterase [Haloactinomyces albus]